MSALTPNARALFLSALAAIFWGTNFEATRLVLTDLPPWTAAALRFTLAAGRQCCGWRSPKGWTGRCCAATRWPSWCSG